MSHRRTRRASRTAAALLSRLPLRVERLERRSMLASDAAALFAVAVGESVTGVEGIADVTAVDAVCPIACEPCVMIDPEFVIDARITTDPPDLWLPIAVDPGTCAVGADPQGLALGTEDVSAGDFAGGDAVAPDPSTGGETTSGSEDVGATEATESALPEGASLVICPAWIDQPVLEVAEPMPVVDPILIVDPVLQVDPSAVDPTVVGDSVEATSADVGVGDATGVGTTDVGITDEVVIEPWFRVFRYDGPPILCYCSGGLDGTVVADDVVASSDVTAESSADERGFMEVAVVSAPENASFAPANPTLSAGPSDAARLFAAYAAGLGQGGADAQAPTGFGGRRAVRRAS